MFDPFHPASRHSESPLQYPSAGARTKRDKSMSTQVETPIGVSREHRRAAMASMVGTTVEWYDFFIYAQAASLIFAQLFFAPMGSSGQLVAYVTIGISFVFRPLGAIVAGYFGDKIGRKKVLIATLTLMGAATVGMGLLPTYATIGIWAPIILIVLRILQGFSTGGEWGGAALMAVEHAPKGKRGIYGAATQMGVPLGMLIAVGTLALCTGLLSEEQFEAWGWRIPFLISFVLILVGFYIRRRVEETPVFKELAERKERNHTPVRALWRTNKKQVMLAALSFIGTNGNGYIIVGGFIVAYSTREHGLARVDVLVASLFAAIVWGVFTLLGAHLSDRYARTTIMNLGNAAMVLCAIPFFLLVDTGELHWIYVALGLFAVGLGLSYGPQPALYAEMFPAAVRFSGASIGYAIGTVLGGAFVPTISEALFKGTGTSMSISIYLMILAAISFVATSRIKNRRDEDLNV
ncbi:major facilitator superfamily transporter [Rhodococcus sp. B7740]|nr:major facilitator superfamily transporter [Rhodococcus sp. B7740]